MVGLGRAAPAVVWPCAAPAGMTSAVIAVPCDEKKVKKPLGEESCRRNGSGILRLASAGRHRLAKRVVVTFANGVRLSKSPMRALESKVPRVCNAAQATRPRNRVPQCNASSLQQQPRALSADPQYLMLQGTQHCAVRCDAFASRIVT